LTASSPTLLERFGTYRFEPWAAEFQCKTRISTINGIRAAPGLPVLLEEQPWETRERQ
jgi:hypothetical protein